MCSIHQEAVTTSKLTAGQPPSSDTSSSSSLSSSSPSSLAATTTYIPTAPPTPIQPKSSQTKYQRNKYKQAKQSKHDNHDHKNCECGRRLSDHDKLSSGSSSSLSYKPLPIEYGQDDYSPERLQLSQQITKI